MIQSGWLDSVNQLLFMDVKLQSGDWLKTLSYMLVSVVYTLYSSIGHM